ncbi:ATP-dependent Clp protease adaptor protein ClpS [Deinococcus sp. HSC-46F16]|uniref:ATP-dependent Clp protease adapter ClpS n=1 Tax=Deinococcus sp. HSC-46F16 TaxID=2910968 RepID=UPI00209E8460|nr:ATP-dependent Clp protease adapter ClpS [Deinococcus sp. HSC-46F16]MCP2015573.1 ATP-dependent Clp protease adaptor protein ClpS [Deinococcus sp. HSC-46F16]
MTRRDADPTTQGRTQTLERTQTQRPRLYRVLLLNDDYTPMDFVVTVLEHHFRKSEQEAQLIMLAVHHKGQGVAGVYTRDVAETKVARVTAEARQHGYPLRLVAEPEASE